MHWRLNGQGDDRPGRPVQKVLAFELYLQDFSWQADQAGFGHVGWPIVRWPLARVPVVRWTIKRGPGEFLRLRLSLRAIAAEPLHFDAEGAFQLKKVGALVPDEKRRGYSASRNG